MTKEEFMGFWNHPERNTTEEERQARLEYTLTNITYEQLQQKLEEICQAELEKALKK